MPRKTESLSIVKRHKTMLATTKTASTATVTPRAQFEPKFRTVLAPNANWPTWTEKTKK